MAFVAGTGAATAQACSLATVTSEERVASADIALTAKVTQVRELAQSPSDPRPWYSATLRVSWIYKGSAPGLTPTAASP